MVNDVMANVPQAVWRKGGQKGNAAQYFIELAVWCKALVAGIVPQDEDAAGNKAGDYTKYDLENDAFNKYSSCNRSKPEGCVDQQEQQCPAGLAFCHRNQPAPNDFAVWQGLRWR